MEIPGFKVQSTYHSMLNITFITLKSFFLMEDEKNKSLLSYLCCSHHFFSSLDASNVTPSEIFHACTTHISK